ncbi:MAG: nucleotidyltransferase domain-containing protein [Methylococcaceae bacterium]|nr:MAG: nucleotidyltransferase domain-containing protein [Methylococcaceae bacterium]
MRLSAREVGLIRKVLHEIAPDGRIYLFGSRVDDAKKGGDIDLFLESSIPLDMKTQLALEYRLAAMCDTKVDLLVKNPGQANQEIYDVARQGVLL